MLKGLSTAQYDQYKNAEIKLLSTAQYENVEST